MEMQEKTYTIEQFDQIVELPENSHKLLKFIGGEIFEVPSNPFSSYIGMRILRRLANFVEEHDLGFVTGEAAVYMVSGERYAPDVAYISKIRQPELARQGYNPNPPDLAVGVDFPSTYKSQKDLLTKVVNYLAAGTVVWLLRPETKEVEVYAPSKPKQLVKIDGVLDSGDVLPSFTLPVREIFPS